MSKPWADTIRERERERSYKKDHPDYVQPVQPATPIPFTPLKSVIVTPDVQRRIAEYRKHRSLVE